MRDEHARAGYLSRMPTSEPSADESSANESGAGESSARESSTSEPRPGVLFDIDGTLVDTNYFHAVAWQRAFRQEGVQVTMTEVHHHIGQGASSLMDAVAPDRDKGRDDVVEAAHSEHYASFFGVLQTFPKVRDLLRTLADRGAEVVLATSASERELQALRDALDIEDALATVTSSADAEQAKPAPDIIEVALDRAGLSADRSIMVGDTIWDVASASAAGLPCIGVLTGGISRGELLAAGAVAVYDDVAQLLEQLDESPIGALLRGERAAA